MSALAILSSFISLVSFVSGPSLGSAGLAASPAADRIRAIVQPTARLSRDVRKDIQLEGSIRSFLVHLPPTYDGRRKLPLVLVLHGGGGNYQFAVKMTGMSTKADCENFIAVYPNGQGRFGRFVRTWNAGDCCGYARNHKIDDISFIDALIESLKDELAVDPQRIYLVGFSNGAMMTYEAGCALADKLAGIGIVSGSMTGNERKPVRSLPVVIVHGTSDRHVPIEGGPGKLAKWGYPVNKQSMDYAVDFWVRRNGCSPEPVSFEKGCVAVRKYSGGRDGASVAVYTVKGGGHAWPGGKRAWVGADSPCREFSATDAIWQFFSGQKSNTSASSPNED